MPTILLSPHRRNHGDVPSSMGDCPGVSARPQPPILFHQVMLAAGSSRRRRRIPYRLRAAANRYWQCPNLIFLRSAKAPGSVNFS